MLIHRLFPLRFQSLFRVSPLRPFSKIPSKLKLGSESEFLEGVLKTTPVDDTKSVVAAKVKGKIYAVSGRCTHWAAPLSIGYLDGFKLSCPYHNAPFDIRTGESLQGPGIKPLLSFKTKVVEGEVFAHLTDKYPEERIQVTDPRSFLIIGGGAAGQSCSESLRKAGFKGSITILSTESSLPYDRPLLSKSVLGFPPGFDTLLRPQSFYDDQSISIKLQHQVTKIDPESKTVLCANGSSFKFDKLLIATGAGARVLKPYEDAYANVKGVFTLREMAELSPVQESVKIAKNVVIIGGSFLGMEAATSIKRSLPNVNVTVLDVEEVPLSRALGVDISQQLLQ